VNTVVTANAVALSQVVFSASVNTNASIIDVVSVVPKYPTNIIEAANTNVVTLAAQVFASSVNEASCGDVILTGAYGIAANTTVSASISDNANVTKIILQSVEEAASAEELANALAIFQSRIDELVRVAETESVSINVQCFVVESATISTVFIGSYLWSLINDSQTPNWQQISDSNSVNWALIATTENADWQVINTI